MKNHITTPNSDLSLAFSSWEKLLPEFSSVLGAYFSRKIKGDMVNEQRILLSKIMDKLSNIAKLVVYFEPSNKKKKVETGKNTAGKQQTTPSALDLLVENECRIQVLF